MTEEGASPQYVVLACRLTGRLLHLLPLTISGVAFSRAGVSASFVDGAEPSTAGAGLVRTCCVVWDIGFSRLKPSISELCGGGGDMLCRQPLDISSPSRPLMPATHPADRGQSARLTIAARLLAPTCTTPIPFNLPLGGVCALTISVSPAAVASNATYVTLTFSDGMLRPARQTTHGL